MAVATDPDWRCCLFHPGEYHAVNFVMSSTLYEWISEWSRLVVAIMTITVKERTREIGTRRALGARQREILSQFLLEAVFLTAAGGVLGVLLGSAIGLAVHFVTGFPISLPWWSFAIGVGFSATVGIVFGIVPAIRASGLDPIEALRYE